MNFGALKFPWGKNKEEVANDEKKDASEGEHEPHLKLVDLEEAKEPKKRTVAEVLKAREKADELLAERKQIKQVSQENRRKLEAKDFSFSAKNQEMVNAVFGEDIARLKEIKKELADLSEEYGIDLEKIAHSPQESLALFEDKVRNSKLDIIQTSSRMYSLESKPLAEIEQAKRQSDRQIERFWELADLYKRYLDKVYPEESKVSNWSATIKKEGDHVSYDDGKFLVLLEDENHWLSKVNPHVHIQDVNQSPLVLQSYHDAEASIKNLMKRYLVYGGERVKEVFLGEEAEKDMHLDAKEFFSMIDEMADYKKRIEDKASFKTYEEKYYVWRNQIVDVSSASREIERSYQSAISHKSTVVKS